MVLILPICRMPTIAVPPVWLNAPVVPEEALLSGAADLQGGGWRHVQRAGLLRLKVPVAPVLTPRTTSSVPATVLRCHR